MLDFFRKRRAEGRLVFLCLHPTERDHTLILRQTCERFLFVFQGTVTQAPDWTTLLQDDRARTYLRDIANV